MGMQVNQFPSIEQMTRQLSPGNNVGSVRDRQLYDTSFRKVLEEKQADYDTIDLRFSKHANERMQNRHIHLTDDQLQRLETGARRASQKGIQESLVMVDDLAFIVNVKNNVVVTAVKDSEDKIFSNIDGAVIM
jgi:flagellar operon protein